jgi:hypothetical protein
MRATDRTSTGFAATHPLNPEDAAITAAMRAIMSSIKGAGQGIEARGQLRDAVASANAGCTLTASNGSGGYLLQPNLEEFTQAFTQPARAIASSSCVSRCGNQRTRSPRNEVGTIAHRRRPGVLPNRNGGPAGPQRLSRGASVQLIFSFDSHRFP